MWSIESPAKVWNDSAPIIPDQVLYEYDGPLIFVAQFGAVDGFFLKFEDLETSSLYLMAQTTREIVNLVKGGGLSVRGAFNRDVYWILEVRRDLSVQRFWTCEQQLFPSRFLPRRNAALYSHFGAAPNSVEQSHAFFSVDFQGEGLKKTGMRFSSFRGLVDRTYDAMRSILSPLVLMGSRSSTFDFTVNKPIFGSLIISVQNPTLNISNIKKKEGMENADEIAVRGQFVSQRDIFFEEMEEVVASAAGEGISTAMAVAKFALLDKIQEIIPTEDNGLRSVMFSATANNKYDHILVNQKAGLAINKAFREAEAKPIDDFGKVQVINDPSNSFVFMSNRGRQVTCYVSADDYLELRSDPRFRNGVTVKVRGNLTRRPRRDALHAQGLPDIIR